MVKGSGCTEMNWFKILSIIVGGLASAILLWNIIYYAELWSNDSPCGSLSRTTYMAFLLINIVILIPSFLLLAFGIWRFISYEKRVRIVKKVKNKAGQIATSGGTIESVVPEEYYRNVEPVQSSTGVIQPTEQSLQTAKEAAGGKLYAAGSPEAIAAAKAGNAKFI